MRGDHNVYAQNTNNNKNLVTQKLRPIFKCYVRTSHLLSTQKVPLYLVANQFY